MGGAWRCGDGDGDAAKYELRERTLGERVKLCNGAQLRCCCEGALGAPPTCQLADVAMSNTDQLVLGWAFSHGVWLRGIM